MEGYGLCYEFVLGSVELFWVLGASVERVGGWWGAYTYGWGVCMRWTDGLVCFFGIPGHSTLLNLGLLLPGLLLYDLLAFLSFLVV